MLFKFSVCVCSMRNLGVLLLLQLAARTREELSAPSLSNCSFLPGIPEQLNSKWLGVSVHRIYMWMDMAVKPNCPTMGLEDGIGARGWEGCYLTAVLGSKLVKTNKNQTQNKRKVWNFLSFIKEIHEHSFLKSNILHGSGAKWKSLAL